MKTIMYIMTNDTKWLEREQNLSFIPYPGLSFDGLAADQPLKISGMSYDVTKDNFKIRLAWLSQDPLNSAAMMALDVGWKIIEY